MSRHHPSFVGKLRLGQSVAVFFVILLIVAQMAVIFQFSAESTEASGDRSQGVSIFLIKVFCSDFDEWTPTQQQSAVASIHRLVRKTAHFLEYALLGFLSACLLSCIRYYTSGKLKHWQIWVCSISFCLFYAVSDELHQLLVNRGARVSDVLLDVLGAVFGVFGLRFCLWLITRVRRAIQSRRDVSSEGEAIT